MSAEDDLRELIKLARLVVAADGGAITAAFQAHRSHYDAICGRCDADPAYRAEYLAAATQLLPYYRQGPV